MIAGVYVVVLTALSASKYQEMTILECDSKWFSPLDYGRYFCILGRNGLECKWVNHFESHSILAMYEPRKVACCSKYVTIVCNSSVEHI